MKVFSVDLYEYFKIEKNGREGVLKCYVMDNYSEIGIDRKHPAMLVVAGGGYTFRSNREAEPVALAYLPYGFNAFVLDYSVDPFGYPTQLIEGAMAIAYIKENADKLNVDKDHVGAIGFSAGGHLCAMLATLYDRKEVIDALGDRAKNARPDAVVLSYPVITSGPKAHVGSIKVLSHGDEAIKKLMSIENQVTENSVPAYIWCTATDGCVPPQNSMLMASAYLKCGVPFELHIFDKGAHGLSLANQMTHSCGRTDLADTHIGVWFNQSIEWLTRRGFVLIG